MKVYKLVYFLLLHKLEQYNVIVSVLELIVDYLSDRKQVVKHGETVSEPTEVTSAVPQGSNLTSLFYIMYVNDYINY